MNFKLKDRTLLNADIVSPEIAYAEFSQDLTQAYCKEIVETLNYGHEMLMLYKLHRGNDIHGVAEMILKMEKLVKTYEYKVFEIRRNNAKLRL